MIPSRLVNIWSRKLDTLLLFSRIQNSKQLAATIWFHVKELASGRDIARPVEFLVDSSDAIRWRMVTENFFCDSAARTGSRRRKVATVKW